MDFEKIIQQIAKQHGVSELEVYREMQQAVDLGRNNPNKDVKKQWERLGIKAATTKEVVDKLSKEVKKKL